MRKNVISGADPETFQRGWVRPTMVPFPPLSRKIATAKWPFWLCSPPPQKCSTKVGVGVGGGVGVRPPKPPLQICNWIHVNLGQLQVNITYNDTFPFKVSISYELMKCRTSKVGVFREYHGYKWNPLATMDKQNGILFLLRYLVTDTHRRGPRCCLL